MPLELVHRENWLDALRDAIACLNKLQGKADMEAKTGGSICAPSCFCRLNGMRPRGKLSRPKKCARRLKNI